MKSKSESKWNFLTRWVIAHGLVGFLIWFGWSQLAPSFSWGIQYAIAATMGLLFAAAQFVVMPKRWLVSPMKWLIGSSIGWLIGAYFFTSLIYDSGIRDFFVLMPFYVVPSAIIQSWFLHQRFKRAWLWIGAVLAGALVDATFSTNFSFADLSTQIAAQTIIPAITAIITGSILIYMSQALSRESNVLSDEAQNSRVERLQDRDREVHREHPAQKAQSKTSASL